MSDRIVLSGMEFHAFHGVFPEEARLGARFSVDVEITLQIDGSDALEGTVDYSRVHAFVQETVTGPRFQVIEALAVRLAEGILEAHELAGAVTVRVHKPHAPLPGVVRDIFVEVSRQRS